MSPNDPFSFLNDPFFHNKYLNVDFLFNKGYEFLHYIAPFIFKSENVDSLKFFLSILCLFFISIIAYCSVRMLEIRKKEHEHLHHEIAEYARKQAQIQEKIKEGEGISRNPRWRQVLDYTFSPNEGDWKLAIIEADSMLDDLLDQLGFKGATMGEKLKSADPEKFDSLAIAWEVHTIRNSIAHEGTTFDVSQHEAKRVTALYEGIFRKYGFI